MKKAISCLLVLALAMSFTACAELAEVEMPKGNTGSGAKAELQEIGKQNAESVEATVEEFVLLDEKDVKVTAKQMSYGGLFGPEIKILVENNSAKNLTFQTRNSSVNGYMIETMFSVDVAAGKKANDAITFMSEELELAGVKTIADVELSFHVFETDNWDDYLDSAPVVLKTSAAETYEYTYEHEGTLVYDENDVKIIFKELRDDGVLGPELVMYIYNGSSKPVTVQTREVSVNGFMVDPVFSADVGPGKHAVSGVTFLESDLEENAIEEITDVELSFNLFNTETWKDIDDTDVVSLSFS